MPSTASTRHAIDAGDPWAEGFQKQGTPRWHVGSKVGSTVGAYEGSGEGLEVGAGDGLGVGDVDGSYVG